nr:hypothetical protein BaRGS_005830 [Batillaria attramentaria]
MRVIHVSVRVGFSSRRFEPIQEIGTNYGKEKPTVILAWRVVLDAGFLRVCPIQPHFLRRICRLATGSCPARSHSSSFRLLLAVAVRQERQVVRKVEVIQLRPRRHGHP